MRISETDSGHHAELLSSAASTAAMNCLAADKDASFSGPTGMAFANFTISAILNNISSGRSLS
ncbi:MAG: hypothetical protein ACKO7B_07540, partial [Flavobacteriales bacterium]